MKKVICGLVMLSLLSSCGFNKKEKTDEASLRLNWLTTCSYAGETVGSEKFAEKNSIKLRIDKGGPGLDPIKLVESGVNIFGVAGADLVLMANDKGADFVIIGLVNYNSPGVWVSKAEKNIKTIADIKPDTRIGELPGGNMLYLYEVFLKKTGLQRNVNFKPVTIPFELKNFIAGDECELRPIFNYEVLPEFDLLGIKYNVIEPKNIGIEFKGPCYFCKRSLLAENPELVQNFVNTMIEGWQYALENPKEAIAALKRFDNSIDERKELIGLQVGRNYLEGYDGKLLYSDVKSWNNMIADMQDLGFLKKNIDINNVLNQSFVEKYYSNK
jgi:NitT/TauT family transport system substrate-binding protein